MTRKIRPLVLGAALLLTGLALPHRAQAFGCASGSWDWRDTGDCCTGATELKHQLHGFRCVNGIWTFTRETICLEDPCGT
jgi:hypothetical protein